MQQDKSSHKGRCKGRSKGPRSGYHLFLREQLDKVTGEGRKNYRSIVSRRWKEIKEDPARLSVYNDRARQMKNEAEKLGNDSQNEKMVADRPAVRLTQKAPKTSRLVDIGSDDSDDEQECVVKKPQKASKTQRLVDTGLDDSDDEQERVVEKPKKAPKSPGFVDTGSDDSDDERESAVR